MLRARQSFRLLTWEDNLTDVAVCLSGKKKGRIQGAGEQWHFHPEIELTLIVQGSGTRFVGDHIEAFEAPDLILIGSNLPHFWTGLRRSSGYAIQFSSQSEHPLWQCEEMAGLQELCRRANRGICFHGSTRDGVANSIQQMTQLNDHSRLAAFLKILADLETAASKNYEVLSRIEFFAELDATRIEAINACVQFVLSHFQRDISLDELLGITHMSKPTFSRQFRRHMGRSFIQFLTEVRVDHACRHLVNTSDAIGDVAFRAGYNNLSHFNRQFRRLCGVSPKEFRANNRRETRS